MFPLVVCMPNIKLGSFWSLCNAADKLSAVFFFFFLFFLQVENNPRTGNFGALVRIFLGRTKELKISTECQEWVWEPQSRGWTRMTVSVMIDAVHVSAVQVHASYCFITGSPGILIFLFTGEKNWSGCSFPWENCWGITINTCGIILRSLPSSISTEIDPAQVTKCA